MIEINTTQRMVRNRETLKPVEPIFEIENIGGVNIFINENFRLMPGQKFGLNLEGLMGKMMQKGYTVEMGTTYQMRFAPPPTPAGTSIWDALILLAYAFACQVTFKQVTATNHH